MVGGVRDEGVGRGFGEELKVEVVEALHLLVDPLVDTAFFDDLNEREDESHDVITMLYDFYEHSMTTSDARKASRMSSAPKPSSVRAIFTSNISKMS